MHIIICITGVSTSLQIIVICIVIFLVSIHMLAKLLKTLITSTLLHISVRWVLLSVPWVFLAGGGAAATETRGSEGPAPLCKATITMAPALHPRVSCDTRSRQLWCGAPRRGHPQKRATARLRLAKKLYFEHDIRSTPFVTNHQYYMSFHKA